MGAETRSFYVRVTGVLLVGGIVLSAIPDRGVDARVHPAHVAFAEVEFDRARSVLEVALRLDPFDLERAIGRDGERTSLESEEAIPRIQNYLRRTFLVRAIPESALDDERAADALPLAEHIWVGREITVGESWIFLEVPIASDSRAIDVSFITFLDLQPDQVNTLLWRDGPERSVRSFWLEHPAGRLRIARRGVAKEPNRERPEQTLDEFTVAEALLETLVVDLRGNEAYALPHAVCFWVGLRFREGDRSDPVLRQFAECVRRARSRSAYPPLRITVLDTAGVGSAVAGDLAFAVEMHAAAAHERVRNGYFSTPDEIERRLADLRRRLGEVDFANAWGESVFGDTGRALERLAARLPAPFAH